jgi:predicted SnoaL-like aldol condensation-catalyzing enzyme
VDDDFLAMYQANYGFHNPTAPEGKDAFAIPSIPMKV